MSKRFLFDIRDLRQILDPDELVDDHVLSEYLASQFEKQHARQSISRRTRIDPTVAFSQKVQLVKRVNRTGVNLTGVFEHELSKMPGDGYFIFDVRKDYLVVEVINGDEKGRRSASN